MNDVFKARENQAGSLERVPNIPDITGRRQAEDMLKRERDFTSAVLETIEALVVVLDTRGRIVRFNRACEYATGYSFKEVEGLAVWDLFLMPEETGQVKAVFDRLNSCNFPLEHENHWLTKDGGHRLIRWSNTVILNDNDTVEYIIGTGIDITECRRVEGELKDYYSRLESLVNERTAELKKVNNLLYQEVEDRKLAEKALTEKSMILEMFFQYTLSPLVILDRDFNFIRVNEAYARADNRNVDDFIGKNHFDLYPSDALDIFLNVVETKKPYQAIARPFIYPDHPERGVTYWDWTLIPILDASGEVGLLIFSLNDVTRRVNAEIAMRKALVEAEKQRKEILALHKSSRAVLEYPLFKDAARIIYETCRDLLGATSGYVCLKNKGGENEAVYLDSGAHGCTVDPSLPMPIRGLRALAYSKGKVVYQNNFSGCQWVKYLPEGHLKLDNALFAPLVIKGETWGLLAFGNKPGGFTEDDVRMATAFSKDVSMALYNSRLLESLRYSEEHFRSVAQSATDAIISVDTSGRIIYWNSAAENIFGYGAGEAIGSPLTRIVPERFQKLYGFGVHRISKGGSSGIVGKTVELVGLRKDGREIPVEISVSKWASKEGECLTGIVRDITRRKQDEAALRLSEERFAKSFNASPNPMSISRLSDGIYIDVNESLLNIFGYQREEVIGRTAAELNIWVNINDCDRVWQMLHDHEKARNLDISFRTRDGKVREGLFSAEIISLRGDQYVLSVFNDLTERKQLEKDLARLDRLNLVGLMAAGIGHEIRNPMTAVRGFLQLLESKNEHSQHRHYFNIMIEELDRANSIIKEFLSLARDRQVSLEDHNINAILEVLRPLIAANAMSVGVDILMDLGEVPALAVNENEIRQLVLNLVRNGLEAMPGGGQLVIKTFIDGGDMVLSVRDQGKGIDPEVLGKIGMPFITTKSNGTGLGLAVCYGIAARHNATIDIETGSAGTTFSVRFRLKESCAA